MSVPAARAPRSRRRLRRTLIGLLIVETAAWTVAAATSNAGLHAAALGLAFPGGGFVAGPDPWLLAIVIIALAISLVAWLGIGAIVAPALVWLGALIGAALTASTPADRGGDPWLAGALAAIVLGPVGRAARRPQATESRVLTFVIDESRPRRELDDSDLHALRFIADLALQPVEDFAGFTTRDQFREAAWRYQLTAMGWALAAYQHNHTPAFSGWLTEAQRRLIAKHTDPRVWRYWRWENLVGNLRWDPDPIRRENIMLSGYLLVSLGAYESGTGDAEFAGPDSLIFDDGRHRYRYDATAIAEAVSGQMTDSWACAYPCEPNWIFAYCNLVGMNGLLIHDRLHRTECGERIRARFATTLREEFISPRGELRTIRSSRFGFALPVKGIANDLTLTTLVHPIDPDLAAWSWDRARSMIAVDGDGLLVTQAGGIDRVDPGNYTIGSGFMYGTAMTAAAEMGDWDIVDAARRSIDATATPTISDGSARWDMSTFANANAAIGRFNRAGGWRDLVRRGLDSVQGPRLAEVAYPEVLVTSAVTDGADLRLELAPGTSAHGHASLGVESLRPGVTYRVVGGTEPTTSADGRGTATIDVELRGRQRVSLSPAG